ncbi:MAG: cytochrome b5-like heme/steroid binding domain-containing protein [Candidatus Nomurabacteria bacterium]|nr:cytochrome b5-like heme/steroid binding domain-containing protein [Candidatus Nomurabacteria bacterium]
MKNTIFAIMLTVLVIGGGWFYYNFTQYAPKTYVKDIEVTNSDDTANKNIISTTINTETGTTSTTTPLFTLTSIASHKDASSCYSVISKSVYDLTMWVNIHPGGKGAILSICGRDGTEAFMNQHKGGDKFMKILSRYKIGNLM